LDDNQWQLDTTHLDNNQWQLGASPTNHANPDTPTHATTTHHVAQRCVAIPCSVGQRFKTFPVGGQRRLANGIEKGMGCRGSIGTRLQLDNNCSFCLDDNQWQLDATHLDNNRWQLDTTHLDNDQWQLDSSLDDNRWPLDTTHLDNNQWQLDTTHLDNDKWQLDSSQLHSIRSGRPRSIWQLDYSFSLDDNQWQLDTTHLDNNQWQLD
jgi:hypothetical protein